ncbi:MAG: ComEA family DNA-binding protein [Actinomycetes bacterium]|jgi:competence protein ComEA
MFDLNISPEQKRALVIVFALCLGLGGFFLLNSKPTAAPEIVQDLVIPIQETATSEVIVNVAGKVANPGVYKLPMGSRVVDAINLAGNQLKGVDISDINLARVLVDGEQILVGTPPAAAAKKAAAKISTSNPLDLNRATAAQLDTLPGIGPVTAQRILDYRSKVGRINSVDELKKISGLGGAKFEEIKNLLRV